LLARRVVVQAASIVSLTALVAACGPATSGSALPTPRAAPPESRPPVLTPAPGLGGGDARTGQRLLIEKGCGGCHTLAGVPDASGVAGPNLTNIGLRPTLAGAAISNSPQTMVAWLMNPAGLKPDTRMPNLGLTQQEAQDLTAFLFSQPYNPPT
jgi:cytochrome c1